MGFFWLCSCGHKNNYKGKKTRDANSTCSNCKKTSKIWSKQIIPKTVIIPTKNQPKTNRIQPKKLELNGMVQSLIIALNYAINTIKNKDDVKDKKVDSTWYQHYKSWSRIRKYFQSLEEDK